MGHNLVDSSAIPLYLVSFLIWSLPGMCVSRCVCVCLGGAALLVLGLMIVILNVNCWPIGDTFCNVFCSVRSNSRLDTNPLYFLRCAGVKRLTCLQERDSSARSVMYLRQIYEQMRSINGLPGERKLRPMTYGPTKERRRPRVWKSYRLTFRNFTCPTSFGKDGERFSVSLVRQQT